MSSAPFRPSAPDTEFLPVNAADIEKRGCNCPDFVYVTGDAYVDHPSFGAAVISRVLENAAYRVAMRAHFFMGILLVFTDFGLRVNGTY